MISARSLRLRIPAQDRSELTFCDTTEEGLVAWLAELPMTDPAASGARVHDGLQEVLELDTGAETRFLLLERLRPTVHYLCTALGRHVAGGALQLREAAQREVDLAQAMQWRLAAGYEAVVVDGLEAGVRVDPSTAHADPAACMLVAAHRAIADLTRVLVRAQQLYVPEPAGLWRELHQLFAFAESRELHHAGIADAENRMRGRTSIAQGYVRAVLLACARPNKLRQGAIGAVFHVLEDWSRLPRLHRGDGDVPGPYVVDLDGEEPPQPLRRRREGVASALAQLGEPRVVDTEPLITALSAALSGRPEPAGDPVRIPEFVSEELLRHLGEAWSRPPRRAFRRTAAERMLEVCLGLGEAHFHAAGNHELDEMLRAQTTESRAAPDPFQPGLPEVDLTEEDLEEEPEEILDDEPAAPPDALEEAPYDPNRHPVLSVRVTDASPGGYGLAFGDDVPEELHTGVVLGVRERASHHWAVAVVRWLRREPGNTRAGVQILAPRAEAVIARVIGARRAASDWLPALLLPELPALKQPPSVLLPQLDIRAGRKLRIGQWGADLRVHLRSMLESTESFALFEYGEFDDVGRLFRGRAARETDDDDPSAEFAVDPARERR